MGVYRDSTTVPKREVGARVEFGSGAKEGTQGRFGERIFITTGSGRTGHSSTGEFPKGKPAARAGLPIAELESSLLGSGGTVT